MNAYIITGLCIVGYVFIALGVLALCRVAAWADAHIPEVPIIKR